jgi:exodeoxyribonuclease V alpha subunit
MFLASHAVPSAVASRVHRAWGAESIDRLRAEPYCITTLAGIGFQTADALARALGVEADSAMRADAGLLHSLAEAELDGHCFLPAGELLARTRRLLGVPSGPEADGEPISAEALVARVGSLCAEGRLVAEAGAEDGGMPPDGDGVCEVEAEIPLGAGESGTLTQATRVYAAAMHATERRLGEYVAELACTTAQPLTDSARRPASGSFVPTDEQWAAVRLAIEHRLSILTGGPGTGKTTSLRVLVDEVRRSGGQVRLCAPTGKAARRLAAATGQPASTIHRMLEWVPGLGFERDRDNRLADFALLIVDEASMLSVRLAEALFAAVGQSTHVLLVGDVDQLPAVGPGRVLEDLIASEIVPVTALRAVFRQAQRSLIVRAAHAINQGHSPSAAAAAPPAAAGSPAPSAEGSPAPWRAGSQAPSPAAGEPGFDEDPDAPIRDFFVIEREHEADVLAEVSSLACGRIGSHFGLDSALDVQVLAPMRRGDVGIEALNADLRARLNPDGTPVPGTGLRVGDRVIQTRNDYEHDLMNGEVCLVGGHDGERVTLLGDDSRTLRLPLTALDSVELAYAISIHKSQGSQAPAIVLALVRSHRIMLTRNLLYTAVTRAEKACVVVCQPGALDMALRRRDARRRHTRLAEIVTRRSEQVL